MSKNKAFCLFAGNKTFKNNIIFPKKLFHCGILPYECE